LPQMFKMAKKASNYFFKKSHVRDPRPGLPSPDHLT
jgi:hypothetical protein